MFATMLWNKPSKVVYTYMYKHVYTCMCIWWWILQVRCCNNVLECTRSSDPDLSMSTAETVSFCFFVYVIASAVVVSGTDSIYRLFIWGGGRSDSFRACFRLCLRYFLWIFFFLMWRSRANHMFADVNFNTLLCFKWITRMPYMLSSE